VVLNGIRAAPWRFIAHWRIVSLSGIMALSTVANDDKETGGGIDADSLKDK